MNTERAEKLARRAWEFLNEHPDVGLVGVAVGVLLVWQDIGPSVIGVVIILAGGALYATGGDDQG